MDLHIQIGGGAWLPWLLIFPAVVLLWSERTRFTGLWGICIGYALALLVSQLSASAVFSLVALAGAGWAVVRGRSRRVRGIGHAIFILVAIALRLHVAPGFDNPLALEGKASPEGIPFKAYLNLDKTLSAVWVVAYVAWLDSATPTLRRIGTGCAMGFLVFVPLAALAIGFGVVRPEPKLPSSAWLWLLNNVVLVCFAEEAFFRGYVQGGLSRWLVGRRGAEMIAIAIAAVLFGASHFGQGLPMALLSMLAGIGYGIAYRRAGLVGAISAHSTLNIGHFFLLTYPALA